MDFEYKGGNCVVMTAKQGTVIIDGHLSPLGLKDVHAKDAILLATQAGFTNGEARVVIDMPGEYEVRNISILGIPASRMIDHDGQQKATIYRVAFADLRVGIIGHVAVPLTDDQLESLGVIDVLILPVGGGGYTLDAHHAVDIVHKVNPKVVIPTHYSDRQVQYEVPQDSLELFINELGVDIGRETTTKWRVKNGSVPELQTVVELTRTA